MSFAHFAVVARRANRNETSVCAVIACALQSVGRQAVIAPETITYGATCKKMLSLLEAVST
jgi:hypothetical protein